MRDKPSLFFNRELSWLKFNQRVMKEAADPHNPLLERLKFFCIANSNLDEFFEVRIAGLKQQMESNVVKHSMDGRTATEIFQAASLRIHQMVDDLFRSWRENLRPALAKKGFCFCEIQDLGPEDLVWLEQFFKKSIRPVLTPLSVDPSKNFPLILNKSLNIIVRVERSCARGSEQRLCIVQVPRVISRLVRLPRENVGHEYVFLSDVISHFIGSLFPGNKVLGNWPFRLTRNSELYVAEDDAENLLQAVENELRNRRRGDAVRLEIDHRCPKNLVTELLSKLELTNADLYRIDGPVNPIHLNILLGGDHSPDIRDSPFIAPKAPIFRGRSNMFEVIRRQDVLLHHPYESFDSVVDFLNQAADDPKVLAIKQTLYRTGGDRRIVDALMRSAQNGKQVAVGVELKARFDEALNIRWAREMEEAGVQVSYGLVNYKVHAKLCLVIRKEKDGLRRYLHMATGNYNPDTSRLYTDLGIFTSREDFGEDASSLFNLLTGFCQFQSTKKLIVAPFEFQPITIDLIRQETANAAAGKPARIIAKMNSLVDKPVIEALYDASRAGVPIDLIVRGICCLRPGVPKLSDNITVRSIVDRFLEHSRIFFFENNGNPKVFAGSGDWMYRNFAKRVEVSFPLEDEEIKRRVINEIFPIYLNDNMKAHELQSDGTYVQLKPGGGEQAIRSQSEFISIAKATTWDQKKKSEASDLRLQAIQSPKENKDAA
ncbi:MAG: polyphosphate kinase 1 [Verrucomicrobiota bacterium]|nr:polyphosphate kinase 1 [Verrucomicrobiota bacterium]